MASAVLMCGIDWAEAHHDVALVDEGGMVMARKRVSADLPGFTALLELIAEHGGSPGVRPGRARGLPGGGASASEAAGRSESPRGQAPSARRSARPSGAWARSGQDYLRTDLLARLCTPALSVGVEEIDGVREVMVLDVEVARGPGRADG